ncbi:DUF6786 family protein [Aeoliella mucimassa]|uniref:Uncharacterized protein n=1 Tax=Aeoliella mucimassa TaxID=2527972 RepID=A0A518AM16_9BACT|nr:DUF6786 family protein [Aeoliella mucimassa]QDU55767.1 hypothetical protein Pan181_19620 [Aeoliella mucimassa]
MRRSKLRLQASRKDQRALQNCLHLWLAALFVMTMAGCNESVESTDGPAESSAAIEESDEMQQDKNFGRDVEFLNEYVKTIVLRSDDGQSLVAVVPDYQGRVMTSSATGAEGTSFGWINYKHIESREVAKHINVYGGEERFWLGPEGGQFSIFFAPGAKFDLSDWQTPASIDTEPFEVVSQDDSQASFTREATLQNYSGSQFKLRIDRQVELVAPSAAQESLEIDAEGLQLVGYRTTNSVTNTGDNPWTKESGMLSIWLLGMYKPGLETTIVVPYEQGSDEQLGPIVNDAYFGKVPAERLEATDGVIFMSGDGKYRSKIGLSPQRAKQVCGSYDAKRQVLTIVKYNMPAGVADYVNSMWELQESPFAGDTVNAYNDGPPEPGAEPLGPFYELETSSPALALSPSETGTHISETYHLQGDAASLDRVAQQVFGVGLQSIRSALQ